MAHLRSLALLLEVPGGEEVKVWTGSVLEIISRPPPIESVLFFSELLAPGGGGFEGVTREAFRGRFAGDLSCLERLSLGGLL